MPASPPTSLPGGPLDLSLAEAHTATFVTITVAQLLAIFNARTDAGSGFRGATANPYLWGALGVTLALEATALALPTLRDLLHLTTLGWVVWAVVLTLAAAPLTLTQALRVVRARRPDWSGTPMYCRPSPCQRRWLTPAGSGPQTKGRRPPRRTGIPTTMAAGRSLDSGSSGAREDRLTEAGEVARRSG